MLARVCLWVSVCTHARLHARLCVRVCLLRIVCTDKILRFINTLIILSLLNQNNLEGNYFIIIKPE